jgi:DUF1365 family protein
VKSKIYHGRVWHMRSRPRYFFSYGAFYLDLALEELDEVARRIRVFSHNGLNLLSLHDGDYDALSGHDAAACEPGGLSLLTQPRVLNYAFNPVSFLIYRAASRRVSHVRAEVHNTWGERHVYELAPRGDDNNYRSGTDKAFYVSPFMDLEGRYEFLLSESADRLRLRIDEYRDGGPEALFRAGMDLAPLPLTNANVVRMLVRYPGVTFQTIAAIHWQGLKLWLRREPFRPNPSRRRGHRPEVLP